MQIWLLACYESTLWVWQSLSAHCCSSLVEATWVQSGKCAATSTEGQTRLRSSFKSSWGKIPVPVLLMNLDVGMYWHIGFSWESEEGQFPWSLCCSRGSNCWLLELGLKQRLWPGFCSRHRQNLLFLLSMKQEILDLPTDSQNSLLETFFRSLASYCSALSKKRQRSSVRLWELSWWSWCLLYNAVL